MPPEPALPARRRDIRAQRVAHHFHLFAHRTPTEPLRVLRSAQLTINGQLDDVTHSGLSFQYYEDGLLSVNWIYPVAGPKEGGYDVTIYGTGFKTLGVPSREWGGTRGIKCLWGHLPPVEASVLYEIGAEEVRVPEWSHLGAPVDSFGCLVIVAWWCIGDVSGCPHLGLLVVTPHPLRCDRRWVMTRQSRATHSHSPLQSSAVRPCGRTSRGTQRIRSLSGRQILKRRAIVRPEARRSTSRRVMTAPGVKVSVDRGRRRAPLVRLLVAPSPRFARFHSSQNRAAREAAHVPLPCIPACPTNPATSRRVRHGRSKDRLPRGDAQ